MSEGTHLILAFRDNNLWIFATVSIAEAGYTLEILLVSSNRSRSTCRQRRRTTKKSELSPKVQAACFRFLRHASNPIRPRPPAKSGPLGSWGSTFVSYGWGVRRLASRDRRW